MVGRKQEIKTLDEVMSRNQGQLVAVYGRRLFLDDLFDA